MSFSEFLAAISEAPLISVARHWNAARGPRLLPCWRDIDPTEIPEQLPIVWAWRWDAGRDDFIGRLAGEEVEDVLGGSIRGRSLQDMFGPAAIRIKSRYQQILRGPELVYSAGPFYSQHERRGYAERVILPLGPDSGGDGGIMGATVYHLRPTARAGKPAFDQDKEVRRAFPL